MGRDGPAGPLPRWASGVVLRLAQLGQRPSRASAGTICCPRASVAVLQLAQIWLSVAQMVASLAQSEHRPLLAPQPPGQDQFLNSTPRSFSPPSY